MRRFVTLTACFVAVFGAVVCTVVQERKQAADPIDSNKPEQFRLKHETAVHVVDIVRHYEQNEQLADREYQGKRRQFYGMVRLVGVGLERPVVFLEAGQRNNYVVCYLDLKPEVKPFQFVQMEGRCRGRSQLEADKTQGAVKFDDCTLIRVIEQNELEAP